MNSLLRRIKVCYKKNTFIGTQKYQFLITVNIKTCDFSLYSWFYQFMTKFVKSYSLFGQHVCFYIGYYRRVWLENVSRKRSIQRIVQIALIQHSRLRPFLLR